LILVCGLWFVVCGFWFVVCGLWFVVFGFWFLVFESNSNIIERFFVPSEFQREPHQLIFLQMNVLSRKYG